MYINRKICVRVNQPVNQFTALFLVQLLDSTVQNLTEFFRPDGLHQIMQRCHLVSLRNIVRIPRDAHCIPTLPCLALYKTG